MSTHLSNTVAGAGAAAVAEREKTNAGAKVVRDEERKQKRFIEEKTSSSVSLSLSQLFFNNFSFLLIEDS
jgi:hypothetical protein